jgi:hypothetical protein
MKDFVKDLESSARENEDVPRVVHTAHHPGAEAVADNEPFHGKATA